MKSVLISIQPKWCELIASGKKTVEVRKTKPKLETPFKVYIYETKESKRRFLNHRFNSQFSGHSNYTEMGKVIGEFVCYKVEQGHILWVKEEPEYYDKVDEKTRLTYRQTLDYLGEKGIGCFWHISDLVIYDKPKELSEFKKHNRTCYYDHLGLATPRCKDCKGCQVTRPPQSWCYVEGGSL
jgi:predicted transcriptional regulator